MRFARHDGTSVAISPTIASATGTSIVVRASVAATPKSRPSRALLATRAATVPQTRPIAINRRPDAATQPMTAGPPTPSGCGIAGGFERRRNLEEVAAHQHGRCKSDHVIEGPCQMRRVGKIGLVRRGRDRPFAPDDEGRDSPCPRCRHHDTANDAELPRPRAHRFSSGTGARTASGRKRSDRSRVLSNMAAHARSTHI